ncbi:MAG: DUF4387 domain-containing protein [Armatimonadetes bacterium]|nr:DUF4387 domain-containing protein [Armatimonadota bacterium]
MLGLGEAGPAHVGGGAFRGSHREGGGTRAYGKEKECLVAEVSLRDLCAVIRSKQAGPFRLTFDLIFRDEETYERVKASGALTRRMVAALYRVPEGHITDFVFYDPGRAVKISMLRPRVAGDPGDGDVYGCQQHAPLLGVRLTLS